MTFNDLLTRANLNSIESYLLYGSGNSGKPSEKTYAERLKEAHKKAKAFFESRFTDIDDYDEIAGYYDNEVAVFGDVYFEIGLIVGAKTAFQIRGKMEELKQSGLPF